MDTGYGGLAVPDKPGYRLSGTGVQTTDEQCTFEQVRGKSVALEKLGL